MPFRLEEEVRAWTRRLRGESCLAPDDAEELEGHLWALIEADLYAGVRPEAAFLRARESLGSEQALAAEFAILYEEDAMDFEKEITEHREDPPALETLYHQKPQAFTASLARVADRFPESPILATWKARLSWSPFLADRGRALVEVLAVAGLCLLSAAAVKLPALWGADALAADTGANALYALNLSFFFMPMVAAFYFTRQRARPAVMLAVAGLFAAALFGINLLPAQAPWQTRTLSVIHLPFLLWIVTGAAFAGNDWRSLPVRIDFVRATGEIFIYVVLFALGGGVLTAITIQLFHVIGRDVQDAYARWVVLIGAAAAPVVAAALAERKRGLAESFAPVLSYVFTPLFLLTLAVFLVLLAAGGQDPYTDRGSLFLFNVLLVLVIALVVFNVSERKPGPVARLYDPLNAALILAALAVDAVALTAVIGRLASLGASPNRVALLAENLVLLVNLGGLAVQYGRFFAKKAPFSAVENWTARCVPLYALWLAVAAFLFPVLFGYA